MERELANISDFNTTVDYAEMFASFIGDFCRCAGGKSRGQDSSTQILPRVTRRGISLPTLFVRRDTTELYIPQCVMMGALALWLSCLTRFNQ